MKLDEYKLVFENQSIDSASQYIAIQETKFHVFLKQKHSSEKHVFRVNKKTLKVKGINNGPTPYQWDAPTAILKMK
jgi:uncharacterized membrane protein YsdA (DUF1294 family)